MKAGTEYIELSGIIVRREFTQRYVRGIGHAAL